MIMQEKKPLAFKGNYLEDLLRPKAGSNVRENHKIGFGIRPRWGGDRGDPKVTDWRDMSIIWNDPKLYELQNSRER
jgi:hypothetical protein